MVYNRLVALDQRSQELKDFSLSDFVDDYVQEQARDPDAHACLSRLHAYF